ncbi:hypothetical protein SS50377_27251 [Spironucleus salmonicida]|uniref:Uncharacterized protein n=1 Tax=Spironucleus salmonicida TaxID=348837 RepID=V6LU46_9EUKA|nr:hypothetical protein SS50377_27251 [Spironucleus salmonicida]|eukprot:EST44319.1 Hypothetical protein SS50377_15857 [Spironucleus salmonicida]
MQNLIKQEYAQLTNLIKTKNLREYQEITISNAITFLYNLNDELSEKIKLTLLNHPKSSQEALSYGYLNGISNKSEIAFACAQIGICGRVVNVESCQFPEIQLNQ